LEKDGGDIFIGRRGRREEGGKGSTELDFNRLLQLNSRANKKGDKERYVTYFYLP
jgi:hypothetical protein